MIEDKETIEKIKDSLCFLCSYVVNDLRLKIYDKNHEELKRLHKEANELVSIIVASINTARKRNK